MGMTSILTIAKDGQAAPDGSHKLDDGILLNISV